MNDKSMVLSMPDTSCYIGHQYAMMEFLSLIARFV
jgi:hypothetical protein